MVGILLSSLDEEECGTKNRTWKFGLRFGEAPIHEFRAESKMRNQTIPSNDVEPNAKKLFRKSLLLVTSFIPKELENKLISRCALAKRIGSDLAG